MSISTKTRSVAYLPPATGFTVAMLNEIQTLKSAGIKVITVGTTTTSQPRGLKSTSGELAFRDQCSRTIATTLAENDARPEDCLLVGFNMGGSLAAHFAANNKVLGLIASGSIPRLSEFWLSSSHEVAVKARKESPTPDPEFADAVRPFDLTTSVQNLTIPVLLQFGHKDTWIDAKQVAELDRLKPHEVKLTWYDDDHPMTSSKAHADRVTFIESIISI